MASTGVDLRSTTAARLIACAWLLGVVATIGTVQAALIDDFDPPSSAVTATQAGAAPGPAVFPGGPTGQFLRLVNDGVNSQANHYSYDLTDSGAFNSITADLDFRATSVGAAADGFSLILVPTADYGISGPGPVGFDAEEPNLPNTFAVGADLHPAGSVNDVSVHFDGVEIRNAWVNPASLDLDAGLFHRAHVEIQQMGSGSNVAVGLINDVHGTPGPTITPINMAISGLLPYENRVQFSARTGGLNVDVDLDNVEVEYSGPYVPIPSISSMTLIQDFDTNGTTRFHASQNGNGPGPLFTAGGPTGHYLRLVNDGVNDQVNGIGMDRGPDGGVSNAFAAEFDFRAQGGPSPADGFSMILLPTATYNTRGPVPNFSPAEKPNVAGAFAIGFDFYPAGDGTNDVSIHFSGTQIQNVTLDPALVDLDAGVFHRVKLMARHVGDGSEVTVTLTPNVGGTPGTPVTVVSDLYVPGMKPYDYRVGFLGRTGGSNMDVDLDNIATAIVPGDPGPVTRQDFEGGGTRYQGGSYGSLPAPAIVDEGGPNGNFLRLIHDNTGSQTSTVGFDSTAPGPQPQILARFDFRMPDETGHQGCCGERADGFGFSLLDTSTHHVIGPAPAGVEWERPALADALSVGFDIFSGDWEPTGAGHDENTITLNWDGAQVAAFYLDPAAYFDLNNGTFHRANLVITGAGADAFVTMTVTPDVLGQPGAPVTIFANERIAGFDVDAFDFRVGFGARSGGAYTAVDLDNVFVAAVPEPSTLALAASLAAALAAAWMLRRRRRG